MPHASLDLLQGTLDLLVLKTLSWGPAHGYDVARWIQDVTAKGRGALAVEGSAWSTFTQAVGSVMTSADRPAWAK